MDEASAAVPDRELPAPDVPDMNASCDEHPVPQAESDPYDAMSVSSLQESNMFQLFPSRFHMATTIPRHSLRTVALV